VWRLECLSGRQRAGERLEGVLTSERSGRLRHVWARLILARLQHHPHATTNNLPFTSTTTFNHNHNSPHNNNQESANNQNFLSTTLVDLECLIEHTTMLRRVCALKGKAVGRSKRKNFGLCERISDGRRSSHSRVGMAMRHRYSRYCRYSRRTANSRYSSDTALSSDTAAIQQRYSSDTAAVHVQRSDTAEH
jgi:hypothetical protein